MTNTPPELKYTQDHEWVRPQADGVCVIGITDHAQQLLGDMVFVDLPSKGQKVVTGDDFALAESVKAASDIYAPISGEVIEVNEALNDQPELLNQDPYQAGWICKIKVDDITALDKLLDADAYQSLID